MSDDHIPVEELGMLAELPADDARRLHLDQCTACRARWLDFQSFMNPVALPAEAQAEATRATIHAWIERELVREPLGAPAPAPAPRRTPWNVGLRWAVAAGAIAAIGLGLRWNLGRSERTALVRGSAAPGRIELIGAEPRPGGVTRLAWRSLPGDVRYEVRLYRADLTEVTRLSAGADTTLELDATTGADLRRDGQEVTWQVFAVRGGSPLGSSDLGRLRLR